MEKTKEEIIWETAQYISNWVDNGRPVSTKQAVILLEDFLKDINDLEEEKL